MTPSDLRNQNKEKIVIYPTDTVWGIGGNIYSLEVYEEVQRIKGSRPDKPVSILFSSFQQISNCINLPNQLNQAFLEEFFSLETTLCLDIKLIKANQIPPWIYQGSSLIGFRFLKLDIIRKVLEYIGSPIITTSLNSSGEPPILTSEDARIFQQKCAPMAQLFEDKEGELSPSGKSSTIVSYSLEGEFKIIREGYYGEAVRRKYRFSPT